MLGYIWGTVCMQRDAAGEALGQSLVVQFYDTLTIELLPACSIIDCAMPQHAGSRGPTVWP